MSKVRLLIIGTGAMAKAHAEAFVPNPDCDVVAAVDTNAERLTEFCNEHGIPNQFASLDDALAWGEFDAATNVTPDPVHYRTTMPLIAAGKHVLCEKPLAVNAQDATEMADAAEKAGIVNMVNLTYRNGAGLTYAADMVAQGLIGEVRHFEAAYLQSWLTQAAWGDWRTEETWLWRLSTEHGSKGVLGDIGVHIVDFATFVAGSNVSDLSCRLTTFHKAENDQIGDYKLDANDSFNMHVSLENGATGVIHASRFASGHLNDLSLRIYGTKGAIAVQDIDLHSSIRVSIGEDMPKAVWRDVDLEDNPSNFDRFIAAVKAKSQVQPDFRHGATLQKVLDRAEESNAQRSCVMSV